MVFVVNIDSPNKNQVKIGNTKKPVPEPINLADQTESVAEDTILQAYQNVTLVGTPKTIAESSGLSAHHFHINCELSWNQPITCPKEKTSNPRIIDVFTYAT